MTARTVDLADLPGLVGVTLAESPARTITQDDVDRFAQLTGDRQWIHVDPERAAPHGGTIVHGSLLLSLIGGLWTEVLDVRGASRALNYGFDHVRFLAVVPVGSSVRAHTVVSGVLERTDGFRVALDVSLAVEGTPTPALVATSIALFQR